MIQDGKLFKGPVELVQHHEKVLDGFLTKPTHPCERTPEQVPMAWPGVTMLELEQAIIDKAVSMNLTVCANTRSTFSRFVILENSIEQIDDKTKLKFVFCNLSQMNKQKRQLHYFPF